MNLPNALSLLRIILVAPFLIAVIYRHFTLALTIFVLAGLTDFLDGYLARKLKQKTILGTFLDPLGDRLLSTVAFIALGVQGLLPPWLAVTVVAKDIYVVIGAGILHFSGNLSIVKPSYLGKLSTLLQILVVGLALCAVLTPIDRTLLNIFHIITGIVTILACLEYIWGGIQIFVNYSDREEG